MRGGGDLALGDDTIWGPFDAVIVTRNRVAPNRVCRRDQPTETFHFQEIANSLTTHLWRLRKSDVAE